MSRESEIAEIRRTSAIKARGLYAKRNSDIKEEEALHKQRRKDLENAHREEIQRIKNWYIDEMQLEAEYVSDRIVGTQR